MGCKYEWSDESHLILELMVDSPWTWEEFMSQAKQAFAVVKAQGKPCATAVNVTHMGTMPKGNVLGYLTEIENQMPANIFASAIIGAPYIITVFMDILMRLRPRAQRIAIFAKSRQEAYEKIQERYAKLKTSER